ncbi:bifunctional D-glycero-beta-D-manno-heptose-7-phosphate kinase/D-glycero-beta-D-manno-heptose 1-phosphate adenylyltransferase HldE [Seleniivibrio woodruffii]|uniref:Bifunctional protein HldE n=1 Tax=Seleniivibrio woodruffii TaxID=1078050 RepID=A0A4R1K2S0_9BACT|nr:bifunctional D-glycero-beta-D-manno-heptose-7-phosphate kinase/D-glycero-beta-D-manno-heptose 1-phosphate adenylyltransferase HldE [Seleniivibrio woodruffii]TCK58344.1 D-beta-D-heptose 7-phosphate kinase/D-beta-D-heptose 1-phosphate adenosyltransferase [Seleniivibrio woodruffii]TVZ36718.1 D-beta-D-heptose 7-phosphate kinase/D-beta-D-heptose 1-phosphate adenosyltransferase [Seleniivibrio woodruffii]
MSLYDFKGARILVAGDLMLDRYHFGTVSRISPEAPVPVVNVRKTTQTLGGSGNVANNIAHLGADAMVMGIWGADSDAEILKGMMDNINVGYDMVSTGAPTTTKLRVIGEKQQIVRLDFEEILNLTQSQASEVAAKAKEHIKQCGAVVISDYGKGFCTLNVCEEIIRLAEKQGIPVIVDPKGSDWRKYAGATTVTPNVKELAEAVGRHVPNEDEAVVLAAREIIDRVRLKYLVVTRSEKGITVVDGKDYMHFPTEAREVFDVSGAGDTVVASLALGLAKGFSLREAVMVANRAAGIVVGKIGTAPVLLSELNGVHDVKSKLMPLDKLQAELEKARLTGKKIVFTNGCFDILHKGHVTYLKKAAELGDILVLGLNSDDSIRRIKGPSRPINSENDRAEVLAALESIGYITIFDEDTPHDLIKAVAPDVLVKGADYKVEEVVGREFAKKTVLIDFVQGYSTTSVINAMKGDSK